MIAFLRTLWCRAFHRGFSRGYRNGFEAAQLEAPTAFPSDVIDAFHKAQKASHYESKVAALMRLEKAMKAHMIPEGDVS